MRVPCWGCGCISSSVVRVSFAQVGCDEATIAKNVEEVFVLERREGEVAG
jgi:hypothetical protein